MVVIAVILASSAGAAWLCAASSPTSTPPTASIRPSLQLSSSGLTEQSSHAPQPSQASTSSHPALAKTASALHQYAQSHAGFSHATTRHAVPVHK